MELIYFSILALIIMVFILQVQINKLESRIKKTTDKTKINQQLISNIYTLRGINLDDISEKESK